MSDVRSLASYWAGPPCVPKTTLTSEGLDKVSGTVMRAIDPLGLVVGVVRVFEYWDCIPQMPSSPFHSLSHCLIFISVNLLGKSDSCQIRRHWGITHYLFNLPSGVSSFFLSSFLSALLIFFPFFFFPFFLNHMPFPLWVPCLIGVYPVKHFNRWSPQTRAQPHCPRSNYRKNWGLFYWSERGHFHGCQSLLECSHLVFDHSSILNRIATENVPCWDLAESQHISTMISGPLQNLSSLLPIVCD